MNLKKSSKPEVEKLGLSKITPPLLPKNYQEIVAKYQAITGGEVRQIIDAIPLHTVLVNILDPETKREMPIPACFTNWNDQEVMFVPALLLEESALIMEDYYKKRPGSDKVQIISVEELEDWLQIIKKVGYGVSAGKKDALLSRIRYIVNPLYKEPSTNRNPRTEDGGITHFFESEHYKDTSSHKWERLCRQEWMRDAIDIIPRQGSIPFGKAWSCGPNSAARAIHMFGCNMTRRYYVHEFLRNAPNPHFLRNKFGAQINSLGNFVALGASFLAPFTGGATVVPVYLSSFGIKAVGALVSVTAPERDGVNIREQVKQITEYLPGKMRAIYQSYDSWEKCAQDILSDIKQGDPVIAVHMYCAYNAHYINVVGVKVDANNTPVSFMLMETNSELYEISAENMKYFMERKYRSWVDIFSDKNYHMMRFCRS